MTYTAEDGTRHSPGVLAAAHAPFDYQGVELSVSASIGISRFPDNGRHGEELLRNADAAMYRIKQNGRNGLAVSEPGTLQQQQLALARRLQIEAELRHAVHGLGLLPLVTQFEEVKTVRPSHTTLGEVRGAWHALTGVTVSGYEIHHGQTVQHPAMAAAGDVAHTVLPGLAWQNGAGNVLGLYQHGLFEDGNVLRALFGASAPTLDSVFDGLADFIETHFDAGVLSDLTRP